MSKIDSLLDADERVIWRGKPGKKAYILPAFAGTLFALVFLSAVILMLYSGAPLFPLPLFVLCWVVFLIVVPPLYFRKKHQYTEYMLTNQRLIIHSGFGDKNKLPSELEGTVFKYTFRGTWFASFDEIKELVVKQGFWDKIFGTASIYPITPEFPYIPKIYGYVGDKPSRSMVLKKVYNAATGKYEEVPQFIVFLKTQQHPRMAALEKPYAVKRILDETIFGARTNFVSCRYCHYRYDSNKTGKCPHCGAPNP